MVTGFLLVKRKTVPHNTKYEDKTTFIRRFTQREMFESKSARVADKENKRNDEVH